MVFFFFLTNYSYIFLYNNHGDNMRLKNKKKSYFHIIFILIILLIIIYVVKIIFKIETIPTILINDINHHISADYMIKDIVTKQDIEKDTKKILNNIYNQANEEISTENLKTKLNENIKKYLKDRKLSQNEQEAINTLVEKIGGEYESVIIHTKYENTIGEIYAKIMKYFDLAKKVILIAIAVSLIGMILLYYKRIYKSISGYGVAFLSSGSVLVISNLYINMNINVKALTVLNDTISIVIRDTLQSILNSMWIYGISFMVIGILAIIVSNLIHNIKKYKNYEEYKKYKKENKE